MENPKEAPFLGCGERRVIREVSEAKIKMNKTALAAVSNGGDASHPML